MSVFNPTKSVLEITRNLHLLPTEVRTKSLWLLASDEEGRPGGKIPTILMTNDKLQRFSKRLEHEPMDFSVASAIHDNYGYDVGLCLMADNQYCIIDLDYKNVSDEEAAIRLDVFKSILHLFQGCYMEVSQSGKGFHILCKTELLLARNFRKYGIEMYSYKDRFVMLTGNRIDIFQNDSDGKISIDETYLDENKVYKIIRSVDNPIPYRDEQIKEVLAKLGETEVESEETILVEVESDKDDVDLFTEISETNGFGDSLIELTTFDLHTDWSITRYPSASEAMLNFVSIVARFTKSNEQVRRMFYTYIPFSQRDKYLKSYYHIDRCLTIVRTELDTSAVDNFVAGAVSYYYQQQKVAMERRMLAELAVLNDVEEFKGLTSQVSEEMLEIEKTYHEENEQFNDIMYPKNIIGDIARYSQAAASHKLKIAHLAVAIAAIAGIAGRQLRIRGSSCNVAIIVVAPSTMGKETCSKTLATLGRELSPVGGDKFFCFDKIASGQALRTLMSNAPYGSMVTVLTEFTQLLEQMKQGKENAMGGFKTELLDLITKNGKDSVYGGSQHANVENNRASMIAPAFTMIGDTVPDFYEGVTEEMCSGGFLSRFIIMEHDSHIKFRSDPNAHKAELDRKVTDDLTIMVQQIQTAYNRGEFIDVEVDDALVAQDIQAFEDYLTAKYNKATDEPHRQIYGRTLLKTLQIAALSAFCNNHCNPRIRKDDFLWARNLIMRDVFNIERKLNNGELGISERSCRLKLESMIHRFIERKGERDKLAQVHWGDFLDIGVFPRSLLSQRLQGQSFRIGTQSNIRTLDMLLENMLKNGDILELGYEAKDVICNHFNRSIRGKYYILNELKYTSILESLGKPPEEPEAIE